MGVNIRVRFFTLQKEDDETLQLDIVMKHITEYIEAFWQVFGLIT